MQDSQRTRPTLPDGVVSDESQELGAPDEIGHCPVVTWGRFSRRDVRSWGTIVVMSLVWIVGSPRRVWFVAVAVAVAFLLAEAAGARWRLKKGRVDRSGTGTGWLRYGPSIVETGRVDEYAEAVRELGRRLAPIRPELEGFAGVPVVVCAEARDRFGVRRIPGGKHARREELCDVELYLPVACRNWPADALRWVCIDMVLAAGLRSSWKSRRVLMWLHWILAGALSASVIAEVQGTGFRFALPAWPTAVLTFVVAIQVLLVVALAEVARMLRHQVIRADRAATGYVGRDAAEECLGRLPRGDAASRSVLTDLLDELKVLFGRVPSPADRQSALGET